MLLSELAVNQLKNPLQQIFQSVRVSMGCVLDICVPPPLPQQKNMDLEGAAFQFLLATALSPGFSDKETLALLPVLCVEGLLQLFPGLWEIRRWFRTHLLLLR